MFFSFPGGLAIGWLFRDAISVALAEMQNTCRIHAKYANVEVASLHLYVLEIHERRVGPTAVRMAKRTSRCLRLATIPTQIELAGLKGNEWVCTQQEMVNESGRGELDRAQFGNDFSRSLFGCVHGLMVTSSPKRTCLVSAYVPAPVLQDVLPTFGGHGRFDGLSIQKCHHWLFVNCALLHRVGCVRSTAWLDVLILFGPLRCRASLLPCPSTGQQ